VADRACRLLSSSLLMCDKIVETVISLKEKPLLLPKGVLQKELALWCWGVMATIWKNSLIQKNRKQNFCENMLHFQTNPKIF